MSEEIKYPSLFEQGKNLAKYSWDLIKHIHQNQIEYLIVPDHILEERMEICKGCDKFDALQKRCSECGCYIPAKARVSVDGCPLNKWTMMSPEWWEEKFANIQKEMTST